jgi:hypothetical protein
MNKACQQWKEQGNGNKKDEKLASVPYKSKHAATTVDEGAIVADEDLIAMALVVHNESARSEVMYVLDWRSEFVILLDMKTL